jgi:uncharacterized protein (TIGR00255 family)
MIQSMTAYARTQYQAAWGGASCEIRSINHRYLELNIRLPEVLAALELPLRERIRKKITRGKIDVQLSLQTMSHGDANFTINQSLAEQLCRANLVLAAKLPQAAPVNTMDILRWPGILQLADIDINLIQDELFKLLDTTIADLIATRRREGAELTKIFLQRIDEMQAELIKVRICLPGIQADQRAKLVARFNEVKLELNTERFEQEIILFSQKMDVTEEVDRLEAHLKEIRRILAEGGVAGRRLDFLMQELHREANTLGAKSVGLLTTQAAIELKVLIEQFREQVQNVE